MFNPLYPFTTDVLEATINKGCQWFVRNTYLQAGNHFDEQVKGSFIISHFNDWAKSNTHYNSTAHDPHRFLYDCSKGEHKTKLLAAAGQPACPAGIRAAQQRGGAHQPPPAAQPGHQLRAGRRRRPGRLPLPVRPRSVRPGVQRGERLRRRQPPDQRPAAGELFGRSQLQHLAFQPDTLAILEERRAVFQTRRDYLVPALRGLGFDIPITPDGAFYLYAGCDRLGLDAEQLTHALLNQAGVAITPGADFGGFQSASHVRFAYTTSLDRMALGVARIEAFLKTLT